MPSRSIIRTGVGPHREPRNRFPAIAAAINLLAARAARVQSRRNLSRSLSPKLDHSHSITRFDRSRTGPKVTGAAKYAGEFDAPDLAHGYVVSSAIAKGRIKSIDTEAALAVPGVLKVFTHENRPRTAWSSSSHQDQVAPPGSPFRPLYDEKIVYSGQPVALVVAEDVSVARYAASLVKVEYEAEEHVTDLAVRRAEAYVPPKKRSGINPPPASRGDAE